MLADQPLHPLVIHAAANGSEASASIRVPSSDCGARLRASNRSIGVNARRCVRGRPHLRLCFRSRRVGCIRPHMALLDRGAQVAGYRVERVLGRGGMGMVYLATQLSLNRPVALKVIAEELADESGFRERFVEESRTAASIDHPHVIPIYEADQRAGLLFLAMRYVDGPDLKAFIQRRGRLPAHVAVRVVTQAADALDAAHARGLVHRDVKPANVLVASADDRPHSYLTDFGLTKRSASQSGVTRSGEWVGTLDYIAPEQLRGESVDARADVYALGCVLYEALTGRPPFPRDNDVAKLWAHISDPIPAVQALVPEVPAALDEVVARAMAKDRDKRFASAGEFGEAAIEAIDGALTDHAARPRAVVARAASLDNPEDRTDAEVDAPRERPRPLAILGAASGLLCAICFFAAGVIGPPETGPEPGDPGREIIAYFERHSGLRLTSITLNLLGVLFLFGLVAQVRQRIGTPATLALTNFASAAGTITIVVMLIQLTIELVFFLYVIPDDDAATARLLYQLNWIGASGVLVIAGLFVGAASLAMLKAKVLPKLLRYFGLVLAPIMVVGGLVSIDYDLVAAFTTAFVLFIVWLALVGAAELDRLFSDDR